MSSSAIGLELVDLGRMPYAPAYARQQELLDRVLAARESGEPRAGFILCVEHEPVITVTRRPTAMGNLLAGPELLARHGVALAQTDRGGDITYHGPGQLVVYPILDLNFLGLNLHAYMRMLEDAVIGACARFGLAAQRESGATGVWTAGGKVCAMGVRIRKWITLHGLAINVTTNLEHFGLIVPCGLAGRAVTSLSKELGAAAPGMEEVKRVLREELTARVCGARETVP